VPRIELRVPLPEKDQARQLGARWDPQNSTWYVPDGVDATPLQKWIPAPQSPNILAEHWFLATTTRQCWRCHAPTHVFGIVLPEQHEALVVEGTADGSDDYWQPSDLPTMLSYVADVLESVAKRLRSLAPRYHIDYSQTTHSFYWMNHCEHCKAKLGDFETFHEPGATHGKMQLLEILEPFAGSCGSFTVGGIE
jgi:hypothetical protein